MIKNKYNDDAISVLEGLEPVRKRPGMYIGSTGESGLHHLVWEIMDNSIDEAMAGYGDTINVTLEKDGSVTVRDFGRGIPVGTKNGQSTVELIFTSLHAGGKFGQGGYKSSGGLHGVGTSVVNALSEWVKVEVVRDGALYSVHFKNGGKVSKPFGKVKDTKDHNGTSVNFKPDKEIFPSIKFSKSLIETRLKESSFLNRGLKIVLKDNRKEGVKDKTFFSERGIDDFVAEMNKTLLPTGTSINISGTESDIEVEFSLHCNESFSDKTLSFVNNVKTTNGGTHEIGMKTIITKKFNDLARDNKLLKAKDKNFTGDEIREGTVSIIAVRVPENVLEFEGQTKSKLGTQIARTAVSKVVGDGLEEFFKNNKERALGMLEKAFLARKAKEAARKSRDATRKKKEKKEEVIISDKLASAQGKNYEKNELYLVEGEMSPILLNH